MSLLLSVTPGMMVLEFERKLKFRFVGSASFPRERALTAHAECLRRQRTMLCLRFDFILVSLSSFQSTSQFFSLCCNVRPAGTSTVNSFVRCSAQLDWLQQVASTTWFFPAVSKIEFTREICTRFLVSLCSMSPLLKTLPATNNTT